MANNLPSDLQNVLPGPQLGDVKGLSDCIRNGQGRYGTGGIVASTTQTQAGGTSLVYGGNSILTANASDAVTFPKAVAGTMLVIVNHSGQTITAFPFLGDSINAAGANASVTIATATTSVYFSIASSTQWWGGAITNEA